mmetsp:Transcript_69952/g.146244  ORF Transcript_69952/g.146244 Transcript_69952/m.146244 type:complete len:230 (-) Transcript_69952:136-825(-)
MRPPMTPGSKVLNGKPWSGVNHSPFCLKAKRTSRSWSKAQPMSMEVPYSPVSPAGSSPKGPAKCTYRSCLETLLMPRVFRTSHKRTPVQTLLATPPAPQLKPIVFLVMFCSLRRLPAQMKVTGKETTGPYLPATKSSMTRCTGSLSGKEISTLCVPHSSLGTAPWLRTTCSDAGVTHPTSRNLERGGSELKGWRPVSRTMSLWRLIQASGVSASRASTSEACWPGGTAI